MLFATSSLARRVEQAECRLAVDMAETVRARDRAGEVLVAPVGGAAAVFAGTGSPFNKLAGLGFAPLEEEELSRIEGEFARRKAPLQVELASLGDTSVLKLLVQRGYALTGFENVLGLRLDGEPPSRSAADPDGAALGIAVGRASSGELRAWVDVMATGFLEPDTFDGPAPHESFARETMEQGFADTLETPGFSQYLAHRAGVVAGGASMRMHDGVAQLCGAATLPEHRRRGVQTALLQSRLIEAARAGCDIAVVTTSPGSKSQENVQRQGFELLYARAILLRTLS